MTTLSVKDPVVSTNAETATFLGLLFSYNNSLKLYHWHVTGVSSYAKHIALDQAITNLLDATERLVETSYALRGDLDIIIPVTTRTDNIVKCTEEFYKTVESNRKLFPELFTQSIIDDYQETIQQLLYRLRRLQ